MTVPKYILFDLDGTLTESAPGIINSIRYTLDKLGLRPMTDEELKRFVGPPLIESFTRYCGLSHEEAARAVDVYREYFSEKGLFENAVYPGIPECLGALKSAGKKLAVATSKPQVFCERIIRHFGIDGYFDAVVGIPLDREDMTKAEVIKSAMELLGAVPEETVMVGDRDYDVLGARENGIPCIGVLYGYGSREELSAAGAVGICETVADIAASCI